MPVQTPSTIWRGNPPSNLHQPEPQDIVDWAEQMEALVVAPGAAIENLQNAISVLQNAAFEAGQIYSTVSAGIADTVVADEFKVENASADIAFDIYRHDAGGVARFVTSTPSPSSLSAKASATDMRDVLSGAFPTLDRGFSDLNAHYKSNVSGQPVSFGQLATSIVSAQIEGGSVARFTDCTSAAFLQMAQRETISIVPHLRVTVWVRARIVNATSIGSGQANIAISFLNADYAYQSQTTATLNLTTEWQWFTHSFVADGSPESARARAGVLKTAYSDPTAVIEVSHFMTAAIKAGSKSAAQRLDALETGFDEAEARRDIRVAREAMAGGQFVAGVLDVLPRPYLALGHQRLLSSYAGPLMSVRDQNSGEYTILSYGVSGRPVARDLMGPDFERGDFWRLGTLYDQSDNARHAVAPADGHQPLIASIQGDLVTSAQNDLCELTCANTTGYPVGATGFTVGVMLHPSGMNTAREVFYYLARTSSLAALDLSLNASNEVVMAVNSFTSGTFTILKSAPVDMGWVDVVARVDWRTGVATLSVNGVDTVGSVATGSGLTAAHSNMRIFNDTGRDDSFSGALSAVAVWDECLDDARARVVGRAMRACEPNSKPKHLVRIGYMTDTHVLDVANNPPLYYGQSLQKMTQAVAALNAVSPPIDMFVHGGDIIEWQPSVVTNNISIASVKAVTDDLDTPNKLFLLGNHDVATVGPDKAEFVAALGSSLPLYGSATLLGVRLIWLDGNYASDDDNSSLDSIPSGWTHSDTWLPPFQRKWLAQELPKTDMPTLIFSHQPLTGEVNFAMKNSAVVREIIKKSRANVLACIAGHRHGATQWVFDGIPHFDIAAVILGDVGQGANAFAVIDVFENRVEIGGFVDQPDYNKMPR